ncbi:MAG: hypothetical protein AB1810_00110 [Pseudomonadota bacterium]
MEQANAARDIAIANQARFFPFDDLVLNLFKECTPKILVVTDGLTFDGADFGLSDFINTLKNANIHGMKPIVKTAHRGASAADFTNFTFSASTLHISKYDVVFLFGVDSFGTLQQSEINTITDFMNAGGGVFATGDHETLGKALCGDIPRVRGMRRWVGPSASGVDRISTNDPGANNAFDFADQSDAIPQKIYPAYTGTTANSQPHFLLQHPTKKIIEVLPDHPHESECVIPGNLADPTEWPKDAGGQVVSPELVALSMSYGGGFTGKQPISQPRAFGAIGAYDGHKANVGRIAVDATWHHFININMIATGSGPGLAADADVYDRVSTYFKNLAVWLMPKKVRKCLRWPLIITMKKLYPVAEFVPGLVHGERSLAATIEAGRELQATLARFMTPGEQREIIDDLFETQSAHFAKHMAQIEAQPGDIASVFSQSMLPRRLIEQAALGALVYAAARAVPAGADPASALKQAGGMEGLEKAAAASLNDTFRQLGQAMMGGVRKLEMLIEHC